MNDPVPEFSPSKLSHAELSQEDSPQPESYDNDGSYVCESCGEEIVIPLDPAEGHSQNYVEDCPVCCSPNVIHVEWDGASAKVWAEAEQDRF